jgi:DNA-binding transcriptional ArsR family regulator
VFVRTDAMPVGFADIHVPGVTWRFTAKQERVIEALRDAPGRRSARDLAHAADVSKRHVQRTLERLIEEDVVDAVERIGPNGATMYAETGSPNSGVVDLTDADGEVTTAPVLDSYTWAVAIADPSVPAARDEVASTAADDDRPTIWPAETGGDPGDPGG